jgi:hypothetical protein
LRPDDDDGDVTAITDVAARGLINQMMHVLGCVFAKLSLGKLGFVPFDATLAVSCDDDECVLCGCSTLRNGVSSLSLVAGMSSFDI